MIHRPLFRGFWQGGFECSTQTLRSGQRLDMAASTGHDRFAEQDFARLRSVGILTAREGLRWHLIQPRHGVSDFSSVIPILQAARRQGIQLIWDLCHFGWPEHLDVFQQAWIDALAALAADFGKLLRREMSEPAFIAPVNEISFVAWAGGDREYLNPFCAERGPELKCQLVKGYIHAAAALRAELPDVRLVSPEPVIHIAGNPADERDIAQAETYRQSMFEAWDMISGRVYPELGGRSNYLDVMGLNYYDRNQWRNYGPIIRRGEPDYRPFRDIAAEVYRRYERPLFVSETGTEDDGRAEWFSYMASEVQAAREQGVPVAGICLYPIVNHAGWDDNRHCHNGLWDYPDSSGRREIFRPLAEELVQQQFLQGSHHEPLNLPNAADFTPAPVPFSPPMELRFSAAAASHEQICA